MATTEQATRPTEIETLRIQVQLLLKRVSQKDREFALERASLRRQIDRLNAELKAERQR